MADVGTVIGVVSVKITPDSNDFKRDAERQLAVIEKELNAVVKLTIDLSKTALDEAKQKLDHWVRKESPLEIDTKLNMAEANMRLAQARLAEIARDRTVTLIPNVSQTAATRASATIAGLSGARVIGSYFDDIGESIGRLDKSTPKIAAMATATAGLAGWGLSAAANLASLSASLASIAPAALALPGIFGGIAIGLGASIIAFKDAGKYLPNITGKWKAMEKVVSENFWAKAAKPISNLINSLLPQFTKGIERVSGALGSWFGGLASSIKGALNGELASMFENLRRSISIFEAATPAIANLIRDLGQVGANLLPQLAKWVAQIAVNFSNFITKAAKDGSLQNWISNGVVALEQLGSVIKNVGLILGGIGKAATGGGGATLGVFAQTLGAIASVVNTPAFQTGLTTVLQAAFEAMNRIGTYAGPAVLGLFGQLSKLLSTVLPQAGDIIATALSGVATALQNPAISSGIVKLFQGIAQGVNALLPALGPVSTALGALIGVIATLATNLGPVIAEFFTQLAAVIVQLAPTVEQLIPPLSQGLIGALQVVGPLVGSLTKELLQLLHPILSNADAVKVLALAILGFAAAKTAIKGLSNAFGAVATGISGLKKGVTFAKQFAEGFADARAGTSAFATTAGKMGHALDAALEGAGNVARELSAYAESMAQYAAAVIKNGVKMAASAVQSAARTVAAWASAAAAAAVNAAKTVASFVVQTASVVAGWVAQAAAAVANAAVIAAAWLIAYAPLILIGVAVAALVILIIKNWGTIKAVTVAVFSAIASFLVTCWNGIKAAAGAVWNAIVTVITTVVKLIETIFLKWTLVGIILTHWKQIQSDATAIWNAVVNFIKAIPGKIVAFFGAGWNLVKTIANAWANVNTAVADKAKALISYVAGLPAKIVTALGDLSSTLYNAGVKLIQGLISGIGSMFSSVKNKLGDLTGKLTSWKGPPQRDAVLLRGAGQLIIQSLIDGMESKYGDVRSSLKDLTDDIGATSVTAPGVNTSGLAGKVSSAVSAAVNTDGAVVKQFIYNAAPGPQIDSDEALFQGLSRARAVGW